MQLLHSRLGRFAQAAVLVAACATARADVRLPALFTDHMLLQQGRPTPVWGWADSGEAVTVAIAGQEKTATAGDQGKWSLELDSLPAGGPHSLTVRGKNTLEIHDVLVGEVWVCSGQSNMAWTVGRSNRPKEEVAAAKYPLIRVFTVPNRTSDHPLDDVDAKWVVCAPETAAHFSAVGYFFGRALHRELDVPVGLIHTSWGGTPSEAWTSATTLADVPEFHPIVERWETTVANYPAALERHQQAVEEWKKKVAAAKAAGTKPPGRPRGPTGPDHPHRPATLYNAKIAPLLPYAIRGAIWYQGESNAGRAYQYRVIFPAMIRDWRASWRQGDFPFYFVQLANFLAVDPAPVDSAWAELREAQAMTLALPNTGQAVIIDIGEAKDIHPRNKQDVGRRLALIALARDYGHDIVYSGPVFRGLDVAGGKARLDFDHTGGGLVAKGGGPLRGFAIAGADRKFVWADAVIDGESVVVSSPKVPHPVSVRYAWANNPVCNLYNEEGLPASPFRADGWKGVTEKNK